MRARQIVSGAALAAVYVAVTLASQHAGLLPIRPLYEGGAPPPDYRWVNPPSELAAGNKKPLGGSGDILLVDPRTPGKSAIGNVTTDDGQAVLIIPAGGIAQKAGETKAHFTITPLDPDKIGAPPPKMSYDGNAYEVKAEYANSHTPIVIPASSCPTTLTQETACHTIVLRYVYVATDLYRRDGDAWTPTKATVAGAALQAYANTPKLGVFVAMDSGAARRKASRGGNLIAFGIGLAAILVGTAAASWRARRKGKAPAGAKKRGAQGAAKGRNPGNARKKR
jgi:hypothetical protein